MTRIVKRIEETSTTSQRVSQYILDDSDEIIPPKDLNKKQQKEWDRVMNILKQAKLHKVIDGVRLSDHCRAQ